MMSLLFDEMNNLARAERAPLSPTNFFWGTAAPLGSRDPRALFVQRDARLKMLSIMENQLRAPAAPTSCSACFAEAFSTISIIRAACSTLA
jgi:hypothetical protein